MASDFDTDCTGCGQTIDVTTRHLTVEAKFEVQDPPGHVTCIGYAAVIAAYHERCVPPGVDPRLIEAQVSAP